LTIKLRLLLAAIAACALVPLWGYWYSVRHADLNLRVEDYALRSPNQSYGDAHNVSLVFRDTSTARDCAIGRTARLHSGGQSGRGHRQLPTPEPAVAGRVRRLLWAIFEVVVHVGAPRAHRGCHRRRVQPARGASDRGAVKQRLAALVGAASTHRRLAARVLRFRDCDRQPRVRRARPVRTRGSLLVARYSLLVARYSLLVTRRRLVSTMVSNRLV